MFSKFSNIEEIFPEVCASIDWEVQKIAEENTCTPDFQVTTTKGSFISEVKQLETDDFQSGKAFGFEVGKKTKAKLGKARKQLKGQELPTLLVLYDYQRTGQTSWESIISAMYGKLTIPINKETGEAGEMFHGEDAFFRKESNTYISAVSDLSFTKRENQVFPVFTIYHNMFADTPFEKDFFPNNETISNYWFSQEEAA